MTGKLFSPDFRHTVERMINMKKTVSIILALAMVAALSGCDRIDRLKDIELPELPDTNTTELPAETEAQEEAPVSEVKNAPNAKVIARITKTEELHYDPAEGNTLILDFSYETPFIDINGRDDAAGAINEYIAMLDETYYTGNDYGDGTSNGLNMMLELATDNFTYAYETGADVNLEMSSNRTVSIERADDTLLSLLYYTSSYTGEAQGSYSYKGYTFSTENGSIVSFDELSAKPEELREAVLDAVVAKLDGNGQTSLSRDSSGLLKNGSWYLSRSGIVVIIPDDGMSNSADGEKTFEIFYEDLDGLIDEKYLPAQYEATGELSVISQTDFRDGSMEVVDKVIADEQGTELFVAVSGTVYDIRISVVSYTDYSGKFFETQHLWNCSYMNDCALQLKTDIPDGMPNLMISYYTADGQRVNRLLTQSGEDGSLILVDDSIAAVG